MKILKRDFDFMNRIAAADPWLSAFPSRPALIGNVPSNKQLEDSFDQTFGIKLVRKPKFDLLFARARGLLGVSL